MGGRVIMFDRHADFYYAQRSIKSMGAREQSGIWGRQHRMVMIPGLVEKKAGKSREHDGNSRRDKRLRT